jgi:hypothetical protein
MSSKIIYERFLWFHSQMRRGRYPNATTRARHLEISMPMRTVSVKVIYLCNKLSILSSDEFLRSAHDFRPVSRLRLMSGHGVLIIRQPGETTDCRVIKMENGLIGMENK